MNETNLNGYRAALAVLQARLRPDCSSIIEQTRTASHSSELSNVPLHLGDAGTEEFLFELNTTLLENEEYLIHEVEAALRRLDDGSFGKCEQCGGQIMKERLDAIPYARHCIKCAEVASDAPDVNLNAGRPQTPADTLAPEGAMGEYRGRDRQSQFTDVETARDASRNRSDSHAAGTAGGGTAVGGLAGTNQGHGDPNVADLEDAMGSDSFDVTDRRDVDHDTPQSGRSGGAVGGTPAGKRAR